MITPELLADAKKLCLEQTSCIEGCPLYAIRSCVWFPPYPDDEKFYYTVYSWKWKKEVIDVEVQKLRPDDAPIL